MTYSIESAFVRAGAAAAVALQRLIDAVTTAERITRPPRMGHDVDAEDGAELGCESCGGQAPTLSERGWCEGCEYQHERGEPPLNADERVGVRELLERFGLADVPAPSAAGISPPADDGHSPAPPAGGRSRYDQLGGGPW